MSKRSVTGVSIKRHSRKVTQEAEAQGWSRLKQKDWVGCSPLLFTSKSAQLLAMHKTSTHVFL